MFLSCCSVFSCLEKVLDKSMTDFLSFKMWSLHNKRKDEERKVEVKYLAIQTEVFVKTEM